MILVDDEDEEELDGQAMLKRPPLYGDRFDDVIIGDFMDDSIWLDDVCEIEGCITDPISVFISIADAGFDVFEDFLNPVLFRSEDVIF